MRPLGGLVFGPLGDRIGRQWVEALTTAWAPILRVIGLMIIHNVGFYVVFTYLPTHFIKTLKFSRSDSFVSVTVATVVPLALILPLGAWSDRIGRRPMLIAGAAGFALLGYPAFLLLNSGSLVAAMLAHSPLTVIEAVFVSVSLVAAAELFATRVRYSGLSVGYNVSVALFDGTTPYMVTLLAARSGNHYAAGIYVVSAAIVSLLTVLSLVETAGRGLSALGRSRTDRLSSPAAG